MGKLQRQNGREAPAAPRRRRTRPKLSEQEREQLRELTGRGRASVHVFKRARVLQLIDAGLAMQDIPVAVGVAEATVRRIRQRYEQGGLERALYDRPRPGGQARLSSKQQQRIVAMVCGAPPTGRARWTVRLVTEQAIERGIAPQVGRETIRVLLQSHALKPWREKNVEPSGAG